jgi:hypothetical protein
LIPLRKKKEETKMGCLFHKGRQNANITGKEDAKLKEYSW